MPKNQVTDPITDQEIVFARLILSGTMTDRQAAEAAGLNPATAAYTKAKPRVRAYMAEHQAAVRQQLVDQEADQRRRLNLRREQVLDRLWEIASLSPEMTRGSISGQVKALSMIVAIEGLIPDRRAAAPKQESVSPSAPPQIYAPAWLREQQEQTPQAETSESDTPPGPDPAPEEDAPAVAQPEFDPVPPADAALAPMSAFVPDTRVPFSIKRNHYAHYRRK